MELPNLEKAVDFSALLSYGQYDAVVASANYDSNLEGLPEFFAPRPAPMSVSVRG